MNKNCSTKVFSEISFQQEYVYIETTQLIYTANQWIGFYIALTEIEIPQKILFVQRLLQKYYGNDAFYQLLLCFLMFFKLLRIKFLNLLIKNGET